MRTVLVLLLALGLVGCSDVGSLIPYWDDEDDVRRAEAAPPAEPVANAPTPSIPAFQPLSVETAQLPPRAKPAAVSDHCRKIAKLRASDAAYAGEDEETQESVYSRTYADCVAWDSKHAS